DTLAHATAAEKTKIEELIRVRLRETDAMAEAEQKMRDLQNEGRSAVQGIVQAMRDGQSAGNILADVLDRISRKLADMAANNLSDALFGNGKQGGGTGLLGGFLGGLFGGKTEVKANALGDVIGAPTLFAYSNKPGQLGVMGEAGAEAIMPLTHAMGGGVGALIGGRETTLPLTRLTSGKLGVTVPDRVTPFARGGAFGHVPQPPMDMRRGRSAPPQSAGLTGRLEISLSPDLRVEMQQIAGDVAVEVTKTGLEKYTRHVLPDQARRRVKDGRSVG
ncbi:MAG: hypothetical protein Q4G14_14935, partial [Paracoccus sp. (in: a-proteobacteria)]|nr:hypothetical protein [Paracoccus sp. (in: a-proteobacteria)]